MSDRSPSASRRQSRPGLDDTHPRKQRGRRECRVKASPMARLQQKKQAAVTTGSARSTGIPCAMVLRLIRDLLGDRAFLPPSSARSSSRELSLSVGRPGPHDFAVRIGSLVFIEAICVHRVPRYTFVTIAIRPSWSRRDEVKKTWISEKQK